MASHASPPVSSLHARCNVDSDPTTWNENFHNFTRLGFTPRPGETYGPPNPTPRPPVLLCVTADCRTIADDDYIFVRNIVRSRKDPETIFRNRFIVFWAIVLQSAVISHAKRRKSDLLLFLFVCFQLRSILSEKCFSALGPQFTCESTRVCPSTPFAYDYDLRVRKRAE